MREISPSRTKGLTFEATYLGWLDFFKQLAEAAGRVRVTGAPRCWIPFIQYMGHVAAKPVHWFLEDALFDWPPIPCTYEAARRVVEVASTCRPELAHALHLWDLEWRHIEAARYRLRSREDGHASKSFAVSGSASFYRKEVLDYLDLLHAWEPPDVYYNRQLISCPCAADKPYPAPLHKKIREVCPNSYLLISTSVCGVIPEDLWGQDPWYDAGVHCSERVFDETKAFFLAHPHPLPVIVYSDFYAYWVAHGLRAARQPYLTVFGEEPIAGYFDLLSRENLQLLKNTWDSARSTTKG